MSNRYWIQNSLSVGWKTDSDNNFTTSGSYGKTYNNATVSVC